MVEIRQRFDFKNSKSDVTLDKGAHQMVLVSDDEVKMKSVIEVLQSKLARRQVSMKALETISNEGLAAIDGFLLV